MNIIGNIISMVINYRLGYWWTQSMYQNKTQFNVVRDVITPLMCWLLPGIVVHHNINVIYAVLIAPDQASCTVNYRVQSNLINLL